MSLLPLVASLLKEEALIEAPKTATLGRLFDLFLDSPSERQDSTLRTYESVCKRFFRYFDPDADPNDLRAVLANPFWQGRSFFRLDFGNLLSAYIKIGISRFPCQTKKILVLAVKSGLPEPPLTKNDCLEWLDAMADEYAEATLAGCVQRCRTVFSWAKQEGYISENPFVGIPRGSFQNKENERFITADQYRKVLDACPDQTWRTLLALCRIGGLATGLHRKRDQREQPTRHKMRGEYRQPHLAAHRRR